MVSQMMRFPKAALRFRPLGGIVLCILLPNSLLWRFRPLTGMVLHRLLLFLLSRPVFAPLRGWYTKYITEDRKMEELNA